MSAEAMIIHPTTLYAMDTTDPEALTVRAASAPSDEGDALLVFRSRADAEAYRAGTGNHPASEGWRLLDLDRDLIARLLQMHGLGAVVMPEEWTGTGGVDRFSAANFLKLLDTAEIVG